MLHTDYTTVSEPIKPDEAARVRAMDGHNRFWYDYDRNYAGKSELVDCSECAFGCAELIGVDYDPDLGVSFEPVNGSSEIDGEYLCAACTAREVA